MTDEERRRFDALLEAELDVLPAHLHELLEEVPLLVDDRPTRALLRDVGMEGEPDDALCGLHSGVPLTEISVSEGWRPPETIHLFRIGIVEAAGGWPAGDEAVREQIHITLLHELGHHFGLEEEDLDGLGYG